MTSTENAASSWSLREKVLLASAVDRHGIEDWAAISAVLLARVATPHHAAPLRTFSAEACEAKYKEITQASASNGTEKRESAVLDKLKSQYLLELQQAVQKAQRAVGTLESTIKSLLEPSPVAAQKENHSVIEDEATPAKPVEDEIAKSPETFRADHKPPTHDPLSTKTSADLLGTAPLGSADVAQVREREKPGKDNAVPERAKAEDAKLGTPVTADMAAVENAEPAASEGADLAGPKSADVAAPRGTDVALLGSAVVPASKPADVGVLINADAAAARSADLAASEPTDVAATDNILARKPADVPEVDMVYGASPDVGVKESADLAASRSADVATSRSAEVAAERSGDVSITEETGSDEVAVRGLADVAPAPEAADVADRQSGPADGAVAPVDPKEAPAEAAKAPADMATPPADVAKAAADVATPPAEVATDSAVPPAEVAGASAGVAKPTTLADVAKQPAGVASPPAEVAISPPEQATPPADVAPQEPSGPADVAGPNSADVAGPQPADVASPKPADVAAEELKDPAIAHEADEILQTLAKLVEGEEEKKEGFEPRDLLSEDQDMVSASQNLPATQEGPEAQGAVAEPVAQGTGPSEGTVEAVADNGATGEGKPGAVSMPADVSVPNTDIRVPNADISVPNADISSSEATESQGGQKLEEEREKADAQSSKDEQSGAVQRAVPEGDVARLEEKEKAEPLEESKREPGGAVERQPEEDQETRRQEEEATEPQEDKVQEGKERFEDGQESKGEEEQDSKAQEEPEPKPEEDQSPNPYGDQGPLELPGGDRISSAIGLEGLEVPEPGSLLTKGRRGSLVSPRTGTGRSRGRPRNAKTGQFLARPKLDVDSTDGGESEGATPGSTPGGIGVTESAGTPQDAESERGPLADVSPRRGRPPKRPRRGTKGGGRKRRPRVVVAAEPGEQKLSEKLESAAIPATPSEEHDEGGWEEEVGGAKSSSLQKGWRAPLWNILREVGMHKCGPMFRKPVNLKTHPDYANIVKRPVDLSSIKQRLETEVYNPAHNGSVAFQRDMVLMFQNALVYYPSDSQKYHQAVVLRDFALEQMEKVLKLQRTGSSSFRAQSRSDSTALGASTLGQQCQPTFDDSAIDSLLDKGKQYQRRATGSRTAKGVAKKDLARLSSPGSTHKKSSLAPKQVVPEATAEVEKAKGTAKDRKRARESAATGEAPAKRSKSRKR